MDVVGWEPRTGTCPTCGRRYTIRNDGAIRRHGKGGDCLMTDQLPLEIVGAVLAIARLGEGKSNGGKDHVSRDA